MASLRRIIADLEAAGDLRRIDHEFEDRKSTRLNSSHP